MTNTPRVDSERVAPNVCGDHGRFSASAVGDDLSGDRNERIDG